MGYTALLHKLSLLAARGCRVHSYIRMQVSRFLFLDLPPIAISNMQIQQLSIPVSAEPDPVSAEFMLPEKMDFLYVFAHGAGAGMHHSFMVQLATALADVNIGTLRYNFPYMEKGGRRPDRAPVAEVTVLSAIATAHEAFPSTALLAGGKSFGGRMTSQALAKHREPSVKGVVFAGFPLHAAGKAGTERATHLATVGIPMLFLQGTRDPLADIWLMEEVCAGLPAATLEKFEGADHSFKAGKRNLIPLLAQAISDWSKAVLNR